MLGHIKVKEFADSEVFNECYFGTSNNHRLGGVGEIEGQDALVLHVTDGRNARDQTAFYAFRSFLVEIQTNAGYIRPAHW